jgi:hypothetical protein
MRMGGKWTCLRIVPKDEVCYERCGTFRFCYRSWLVGWVRYEGTGVYVMTLCQSRINITPNQMYVRKVNWKLLGMEVISGQL